MPHDADSAHFTVEPQLPELRINKSNLPESAKMLRDILAGAPMLFDRGGVLVLLHQSAENDLPRAKPVTPYSIITLAHEHCRPIQLNKEGHPSGVTLPHQVAQLYLDLPVWNVPPLAGITSAPLLQDDGTISSHNGYHPRSQLWCARAPELTITDRPTKHEAEAALLLVRETFRTFPFEGSPSIAVSNMAVVDTSLPPGVAESSFLSGLLTAVCRPSLQTSPGLLLTAPEITGSGAGKGLLVRAICHIAYGINPAPFTRGHNREELDKRLVSELIEGGPVLFLDNVNGEALKSDTLAMVTTERPARVRMMGVSRMVPLNCAGLIAVTGNGLSVSEDLARRFLIIGLQPQCEDPEARPFPGGFLQGILSRRAELLSAILTIWRWGRQANLKPGLPLASYEQWAQWCRDPLIALGCADPVSRTRQAKQEDPKRRELADFFTTWAQYHGYEAVKAHDLAPAVVDLLDPDHRGRQYVTSRLQQMVGTRAIGFVLTRSQLAGKWAVATYALRPTSEGLGGPREADPMPPMPPMPEPAKGAADDGPSPSDTPQRRPFKYWRDHPKT